jgi:hypothetical protein
MATKATLAVEGMPFTSDIDGKTDGLAPESDMRLSIPQTVYDGLPGILRDICDYFPDGHERDVVLTSLLVVSSGILGNVRFPHKDRWYHVNLFALITADTGSGKGNAALGEKLYEQIENRLKAQHDAALADWEAKKKEIEAVKLRNKTHSRTKEELEEVPELGPKPPLHTLTLAANSSARGFIDRLEMNNGAGIQVETETMTLNINRKQDWGESDLYLKAFHNDTIKLDRKGGECVRIRDPHFATIMTGTPNATRELIPSAEDGLFSRFIHYQYQAPAVWHSQRPTKLSEARDQTLKMAGVSMDQLHQYLEAKGQLVVRIPDKQWDIIDRMCSAATEVLVLNRSNTFLHASVRRAAIIAARIACILAVLRHFERGFLGEKASIETDETDMHCATLLASTYLAHAIELATKLRVEAKANLSGAELTVYTSLPQEPEKVTTKDLSECTGFDIRKVQRILRTLKSKGCVIPYSEKGPYARPQSTGLTDVASVVSVTSFTSNEAETTNATDTTNDNEALKDINPMFD